MGGREGKEEWRCEGGDRKCVTPAQLVAASYSGFAAYELNSLAADERRG